MFSFVLFSGELDTKPDDMAPKVRVSGFASEQQAFGAAALSIDDLNGKHPDRDFRAVIVKNSDLMDMHQLAARGVTRQ